MDNNQFDDIIMQAFKRLKEDEEKVIDIREVAFKKRLKETLKKMGLIS
jgi:hypothetical protein